MSREGRARGAELVSIVIPVYNERENIRACLEGIEAVLGELPHEVLVVYDHPSDTTLTELARMPHPPAGLRAVHNDIAPGVAFALRKGLSEARGDVVVVTMADLSDPPEAIPEMVRKVRREGADVVGGSRYMPGGGQEGGPLLKRTMSRLAGLSLHYLAGLPTRDCTTNFRAYSARLLREASITSSRGFEVALELTVKAHALGFCVDEVPVVWKDRTAGKSNFKLFQTLPAYLGWWAMALRRRFSGPPAPRRGPGA